MAGNIKGIIVEIGGDTSGLQNALKKVNSSTSSLSKELRGIDTLLKLNPKNTELLSQKQTVLNQKMSETEQKLEILQKTKEEADKAMAEGTEISAENYRNLQREIINTESQLKQMKLETSNWTKASKSLDTIGNKVNSIGNKVGNLGATLTKTVTPAITGIATLAITSMDSVDEGIDVIATKTGAFGEDFKELQKNFKNVASEIPSEFEEIGSAIGEINTRLDFTGEQLEEASKDFLKFAKVNGMDVNTSVQLVTRAMGDAGIKAEDYAQLLDMLTVAGQKSGISIDSLTTNLAKYGAPLRALGISTQEAIAMFAGWEKAGVNTEIAFSGMKKAISNWGSAGKDSTKEFKKTLEEIKRCPTIAKATTKAIEVFGAKAGPDLADAIQGGRFEFEKYIEALEQSGLAVESTYDQIVDEVDDTQLAMQNIQLAFHDTGETIAKTLGPQLLDLANDFKNLMNKYDKLDPKMKQNILRWGAMAVAMGPIVGTGGKVISFTGKGIDALSKLTGEIAKVKTGMDVTNTSTGLLAKGISALTTPTGLLISVVAAAAAGLIYFSTKETEAEKKARELSEEIASSKQSMEEYRKQIDETANSNLSHINSVENLRNELNTLVDSNGKVKDGYKSRVSFILNELNSALDTEYKLNGNIIESYKDLKSEIDELIEKKRAEIKLKSLEEKYSFAMENQEEAATKLKTAYENLQKAQEKYGTNLDGLKTKVNEFETAIENGQSFSINEMKEIKYLKNTINAYDDAKNAVQTNTNDMKLYESSYELFVEEKYNEIGNTVKNTTQDWTSSTLETLKNSISEQSYNLELYKQLYEQTGSDIYLQQQQQAQQALENITNELVSRTSTINELGQSEIEAWKNLANSSYEQYSIGLSQMSPEMQKKIQEATGVIAVGTPEMQAKAEELGRKTVEEFDKSSDAKAKALNTITGYLKGLTNEEKREFLKQAGIDNADAVLKELDKGDLSEENGKNILQGLWKGLKNNTWQGKILGAAAGLAQAVNKSFTGKSGWDEHSPSKKMKKFAEYYVQPISDVMNARKRNIVATAKRLAKETNSAFNTEMAIPQTFEKLQGSLNNQIANQNKTIFTTPQIIFNVQELDEAKLQQCFNYINTKFGSKY